MDIMQVAESVSLADLHVLNALKLQLNALNACQDTYSSIRIHALSIAPKDSIEMQIAIV